MRSRTTECEPSSNRGRVKRSNIGLGRCRACIIILICMRTRSIAGRVMWLSTWLSTVIYMVIYVDNSRRLRVETLIPPPLPAPDPEPSLSTVGRGLMQPPFVGRVCDIYTYTYRDASTTGRRHTKLRTGSAVPDTHRVSCELYE